MDTVWYNEIGMDIFLAKYESGMDKGSTKKLLVQLFLTRLARKLSVGLPTGKGW